MPVLIGMVQLLRLFLLSPLYYLVGSIPTGYLYARRRGIDIRKVGSGNIGATNVSRVLGLKGFLVVGLGDWLKGYLAVILAQKYFPEPYLVAILVLMPMIGNLFPVWLKFRGGKGVFVTVGIMTALMPPWWMLIGLTVWLLVLRIVRIMSATNLLLATALPLALWLYYRSDWYLALGLVLAGIIVWTHRENIRRLQQGKEPKIL